MRRYLGSKTKLLHDIDLFIKDINKKHTFFIDAFSGSGKVTEFFAHKYKMLSNDYMYFSYITAAAYNSYKYDEKKLLLMEKELNQIDTTNATEGDFIYNNFSPMGNRKYFSENNAITIDRMRQKIENEYISKNISFDEYTLLLHSLIDSAQTVSNITGTYSAFLKMWDSRALKEMEFKLILPAKKPKKGSETFNKDVIDFMDDIKNVKNSIIYLDPPYTSLDYAGAYHVLETIAKYDSPYIKGISGRRLGKESNYHKKTKALEEFKKLINHIPATNDVVISYSSHGILSLNDFKEIIMSAFPLAKIKIKEIKYGSYSNINSHSKGELKEYLIHFYAHPAIKAPFNYQGSKEKIAYDIRKIIPANKKVVEIFGGGLNLGINIINKDISYNDISKPLVNVIRTMKKSTLKSTLSSIEEVVKEYKMKKNDKESFNNLRKKYNQDHDPYKLLVLLFFTFNYQIRFNSNGEFNNPVGLGGYTSLKKNQVIEYVHALKTKNINFSIKDFRKFNYEKEYGSIFYFDPPYLITTASYNDGKRGGTGWNANMEETLLTKITKLHIEGQSFILSNVIEHKGIKNNILYEWVHANNFKIKKINYKNRVEVLIYNF